MDRELVEKIARRWAIGCTTCRIRHEFGVTLKVIFQLRRDNPDLFRRRRHVGTVEDRDPSGMEILEAAEWIRGSWTETEMSRRYLRSSERMLLGHGDEGVLKSSTGRIFYVAS
jgi:hypothetical protein